MEITFRVSVDFLLGRCSILHLTDTMQQATDIKWSSCVQGAGGATGPYATGRGAAPVGSGPAGVAEPAGTAADTKKGGAFSFYH